MHVPAPRAGAGHPASRHPHSRRTLAVLALLGLALFTAFAALGAWQLERRAWKLALIERVGQRLHAPPSALPPRAGWARVDAASHAYQPVRVQGRWLPGKTVLSQATTALGAGFWVLTPLALDGGGQVLINRGFIPEALRSQWQATDPIAAPAALTGSQASQGATGAVQLTGLVRMSEPGGGFLRRNDPASGRWHSRDVAAMARALALPDAAPFFIDAGIPDDAAATAAPSATRHGDWPRAGLTVVRFHNSHLVYVLTWWGLAALVAGGAIAVVRYERQLRAANRAAHRAAHRTTGPDHAQPR